MLVTLRRVLGCFFILGADFGVALADRDPSGSQSVLIFLVLSGEGRQLDC